MEKNTLVVGVALLLIGLGIGYAFGGREPRVGSHMMPSGSMMSDESMLGQNIDQHFIMQMIPHHEGAIEMAKIALQKSARPEVKTLANAIIEAQTKEIDDMTTWYQAWFDSAPPHMSGMMHMDGMSGDTSRLAAASAAEFDREFLSQMIPHHEMAIMMAQMLKATTGRAEMKQLGENIISSQSAEITTMRGWLQEWYRN